MKSLSFVSNRQPLIRWAAFFLLLTIAAGCDRDGVKVYQVTEEKSSDAPVATLPADAAVAPAQNANSLPQLQFALPSGWQQVAPSQMRVASFSITNADGETADIAVIPLPAEGQDELALVNMWRDQMQLPALTNAAAAETVSVAGSPAKYFEIISEQPLIDGKFRARILIAELTRGNMSWFFKMTGGNDLVVAQKDNFLQFLKSVSFNDAPIPDASAGTQNTLMPNENTPVTGGNSGGPADSIWTIPAGWQTLPPSQFLLAQFSLAGDSGAKAEVNVAELAGEGGGLAMNVNRWRGQLGLEPATEIVSSPLDDSGGKSQVVDFSGTNMKTGKPTRLIGVIVPQNGQTWFYKLMGDDAVVAAQKDAFIKFIQSAQYPK